MIFELTGLDERKPLTVHLAEGQSFQQGGAICMEQMALMEREIVERAIPLPKAGIPERPRGPLTVTRRSGEALSSKHGLAPSSTSSDGPPPLWKRLSFIQARLPGFWLNRLKDTLAATVQEAARPGRILLVGEAVATAALAQALERRGRSTQRAAGSQESWSSRGTLKRPAPDSFFAALQGVSGDLSTFGAIVFVGYHDFVAERAAVLDCTDVAPMVLAKLDASGLADTRVFAPESTQAPANLPRISMVIVSYNQADYLEACIRSVLDQGYPNVEYIIVDGGSTDGSVEIIERYRAAFAHVIIEPDKGQSDALNKGFSRTTGELMNWLCSDDMLAPQALLRIGEAYARHQADLIVGGCRRMHAVPDQPDYIHYSALPFGRTVALDPFDILCFMQSWHRGNYFFQPEVFFSRRIWDAAGAYVKPHLYYAMDYDMWLRMALAGATARVIPHLLGISRVHDAQKTRYDQVYLHQLRIMMEEYSDMFKHLAAAETQAAISA